MKFIKFPLLLIFVITLQLVYSQGVAIGEWRDHLPWSYTISVAKAGNIVYCATPYGLIVYDNEDQSMSKMTKVNGLSDIGISDISYNTTLQTLVISYSNTNIDLIKNDAIINIPDIKRKQILGNKTINKIMLKDDYAYLSCGFGIVVLDIVREEIHDTYYIGPGGIQINVLDMTYNDTSFFAVTEHGIYYADVNSPNLANFAIWQKMQSINPNTEYNLIQEFSGKIIVNRNSVTQSTSDTLYIYDGFSWERFENEDFSEINNLKNNGTKFVIAYNYYVKIYDEQLNELYKIWNYNGETPSPMDAIIDLSNTVWIANREAGLVKSENEGWNSTIIKPVGPGTIDIYDISVVGGNLWMVPGGRTGSWGNLYKSAITYSFINETWKTFAPWNTPALDTLRDLVSVAVNPFNNGQVYVGSWWRGMVEFVNNEFSNIYSKDNSSLEPNLNVGGQIVKVGGIAFDKDNNMWASNSGAEKMLSRRKPNGSWKAFDLGSFSSNKDVGTVITDSYNQKWILARHYQNNENFLYVFNENNSPGEQVKGLKGTEGNGNIPGSNVFCIIEDQEGEVWIGTDEGIGVFYNPEQILTTNNVDAVRPLVNFDGYVQYLLETEVVTAIDIDGANRKWIGTDRAGVFLLSADGTEQIYHFTEDNSPLFSNQVTDIAIDQVTGEVFIGTASGLIAYKSTATGPSAEFTDVHVYPNPVPQGYAGEIGIKGLMNNSIVKITDISGTLVYEVRSEGGQAIWTGTDLSGRRVQSGVYLVFVSNEDGSDKMVTKILFLN